MEDRFREIEHRLKRLQDAASFVFMVSLTGVASALILAGQAVVWMADHISIAWKP